MFSAPSPDLKRTSRHSIRRKSSTRSAEPKTPRWTAFTDGCPGLLRILVDTGVDDPYDPPILDWFHIGMRLQHLKQIANALG